MPHPRQVGKNPEQVVGVRTPRHRRQCSALPTTSASPSTRLSTPSQAPRNCLGMPRRSPCNSQTIPRRCPDNSETTPRRCPDNAEAIPRQFPRDAEAMPRGRWGADALEGTMGGGRAPHDVRDADDTARSGRGVVGVDHEHDRVDRGERHLSGRAARHRLQLLERDRDRTARLVEVDRAPPPRRIVTAGGTELDGNPHRTVGASGERHALVCREPAGDRADDRGELIRGAAAAERVAHRHGRSVDARHHRGRRAIVLDVPRKRNLAGVERGAARDDEHSEEERANQRRPPAATGIRSRAARLSATSSAASKRRTTRSRWLCVCSFR
jgi:hypothetical protein